MGRFFCLYALKNGEKVGAGHDFHFAEFDFRFEERHFRFAGHYFRLMHAK